MCFDQLSGMLDLTAAIADVVADAVSTWMPFHLTRGRAGADCLLAN